jgi:putative glutamine amidotransferase
MLGPRPVVGLDCRYERDEACSALDRLSMRVPYYQALIAAGALPLVIPVVEEHSLLAQYLDIVDAFVFTGGLDVPPEEYGQPKHPETEACDPERFGCDRLLAELLLERDIPVLAICLGMQLINVAYGGTLIQHIETEIQHTHIKPAEDCFHPIGVEEDTLLHGILAVRELEVNSSHHQAVQEVAPGLRVSARAPDAIIEAVEMTDKPFFLGVQWHPERIADRAEQRELFRAFVSATSDGGSS